MRYSPNLGSLLLEKPEKAAKNLATIQQRQTYTREGKGIVSYLIIGVVGALLGGCLFRLLHLAAYGLLGELVIATVGAVILLFVLRKI